MIVLGDRELETQMVAVRSREGEDLGAMSLDEFVTLANGASKS
jgi:threonyl-tRNA synthetase